MLTKLNISHQLRCFCGNNRFYNSLVDMWRFYLQVGVRDVRGCTNFIARVRDSSGEHLEPVGKFQGFCKSNYFTVGYFLSQDIDATVKSTYRN